MLAKLPYRSMQLRLPKCKSSISLIIDPPSSGLSSFFCAFASSYVLPMASVWSLEWYGHWKWYGHWNGMVIGMVLLEFCSADVVLIPAGVWKVYLLSFCINYCSIRSNVLLTCRGSRLWLSHCTYGLALKTCTYQKPARHQSKE